MATTAIIIRDEDMRARVVGHIRNLNLDKPWQITVEPYKQRHTKSQRGLMWIWVEGVVEHVHADTGQDKEDVHEFLKQKFLRPKIIEINGEIVKRYSTTGLSKAGMSEYMNKIYAWSTTEMGLMLPVPEDLGRVA